jgi:hypothetical protein
MSDWQERANKRRDERNTKVSDEPKKTNKAKKDTKTWCKGRVGRDHTPKCMPHKPMIVGKNNKNVFSGWYDYVCTACGKVLDTYYPCSWGNQDRPKPDWLVENNE